MLWCGLFFVVAGVGFAVWGWWFILRARDQSTQALEEMATMIRPTTQEALASVALSSQVVQFWAGFRLASVMYFGCLLLFLGLILLTQRARNARLLKLLAAEETAT